jgi:beta-galactosidase
LDAAHDAGIAVVLGTPTYAVPPWLARLHPEIATEPVTGQPLPWGARQEMDQSHPTYRFYAERVIRAVVGRYCAHPAVVGYQVDNEPGLVLPRNRHVFLGFVDELRRQYGDVEALNRAWGLTYWSHRLSTWDDLWTPDGNTTPSYDLAWRRYQARLTSDFIAWQAGIVREYALDDQFVTTCVDLGRPGVDDPKLTASLDTASVNIYYSTQEALRLPPRPNAAQGWSLADVPALTLALDRAWAAKQAPFFVTETNAGTIGGPDLNYPAYDGQWRQVAWAMVARGARMVEY